MIEIRMPRLSETMKDGKLLLWNVAVGDHVNQGDQVAEIEADKANMEIEAPVSGLICNLYGKPGETITVDSVLVELKEEVSNISDSVSTDAPAASVAQPKPTTDPTPHVESPLERRLKEFSNTDEDVS